MSKQVDFLVYGRMSCPFTANSVRVLKREKKSFNFIDTDSVRQSRNPEDMERMKRAVENQMMSKGKSTIPKVFMMRPGYKDYSFIGGNDELLRVLNQS